MEKGVWDELLKTIVNLLSKSGTYILLIFLGVGGKIGLYLIGDKKLSIWHLIGSTLLAITVGITVAIICMKHFPAHDGSISVQAALLVPCATLLSDRIVMFIMAASLEKTTKLLTSKDWIAIFKIITKGDKKP